MEERISRFAYLLEPIRDLTKNWEVDVASKLDDYLSEIAEITISFDGGATKLNFAEAALLIQGSTCVYSRKVEYLHALVYQTLDLISSKRKLAQGSSVDEQGRDADISFAPRGAEEALVLDDLPVSTNINLVEKNMDNDSMAASAVPRTPLSMIPLKESERVNSTPLLSRTGELLGNTVDFKMNTGYVHSSGALMLEPMGQQVIITVTKRGGAHPINITSNTPAAAVTSMLSGCGATSGVDMDACSVLDDSGVHVCEDADLGASPTVGPASGTSDRPLPHRNPRRKQHARIIDKKQNNPWQPLDPHSRISGDHKPFKKGMTQRVPSVLKQLPGSGTKQHVGRKRGITPCPPVKEPLAEFIRNTFYSCSSLFPKTYLKAPASAEFEGLYWAEQKRRKEEKLRDNKRMRVLRDSKCIGAEIEDDEEDTYQPLGHDVSESEDIATAAATTAVDDTNKGGFDAAFQRFQEGPASFQGVEPMALEETSHLLATSAAHPCDYEDLVRQYMESTATAATVYASDTDLSRRVSEWENKISPILEEEESHPVFNIHECGSWILDSFKSSNSSVLDFILLAEGKEEYEVSRLFAATLQLANDGNVEIAPKENMDAVGLKLLSTRRNFENVSSYTSSSCN